MRDDESPAELRARAVVEHQLDRPLVRIPSITGQAVVDYRTAEEDLAVEVKEVTSEAFRATGAAFASEVTRLDDPHLTGRWGLTLMRPELSGLWPSPHQRMTALPEPAVRLKGLAADLVEPFVTLERFGATTTDIPLPPPHMDPELAQALATIHRRTHGALCYRNDPDPGEPGGIELMLAHVSTRTGLADVLVDRLELWLADPNRILQLGPDIDVVWILVGPVAGRDTAADGWRTWLAPTEAQVA